MSAFDNSLMKATLPTILANFPAEWRGTTFNNSNLLGRAAFCDKMKALIVAKGSGITAEDLVGLGNAEDYLRVSSNISTILELALACDKGFDDIHRVFTFSSSAMPIIAVLLTTTLPVHLYVMEGAKSPFTADLLNVVEQLGCTLHIHNGTPQAHADAIVLASSLSNASVAGADGLINQCILYIENTDKIVPSKVLVIRKRMSTPVSTPNSEAMLRAHCGLPAIDAGTADAAAIADFYAHLQQLTGTDVNPDSNPLCFTAGLPAICSLWFTLMSTGGVDVLMASTAYGGSSELTGLVQSRAPSTFHKHNFDITGKQNISASIQVALDKLASNVSALLPTTVLMVEIPTNPDMKVPEMTYLAAMLTNYQAQTGKRVLLFVDATFAPGSQVMKKMKEAAPDLATMTFISMSKSVSRGLTTGGTLVAGPSEASRAILRQVKAVAAAVDSMAKPDQMLVLTQNHTGVEERCAKAYEVAVNCGNALCDAVAVHCNGHQMELAFVSPKQAALGFTTSTFSFNLPSFEGASAEINEALAQVFVDKLCSHSEFKPCVSFGQDNGLVYATVPATSTQGAIKLEDKAKQAVGGVQLVRVSFSPGVDQTAVSNIFRSAVSLCYTA